jgi:acyl-CoA reductase-like NAD-dependent aldehyde dehydrogenase
MWSNYILFQQFTDAVVKVKSLRVGIDGAEQWMWAAEQCPAARDCGAGGGRRRSGRQCHRRPAVTTLQAIFRPTVLTNVNNSMRIVREETFGPCCRLWWW